MIVSSASMEQARKNFPDFIKETPLECNFRLSERFNCKVYLKREDLQLSRSYKLRGAYNKISQLRDEEKQNGIVCSSAGNHAQGVAIACKHLKIKGTIFMPRTTPMQKIDRTRSFGEEYVTIKVVGDTYDEAYNAAMRFCEDEKATFIHPFDDPMIIAGQGTIAVELLQNINPDVVIVPIGGGGLISGISTYLHEKSPATQVIGVESAGAPSMAESVKQGKIVQLDKIDTFADGVAVKQVGNITYDITNQLVKTILTVPENRLCTTILECLKEEGMVLEPAGALSIDALQDLGDAIQGKTVVCIVSGGNFDFDRLAEVKERSLRFRGKKKYYIVEFAQRAGALREFLDQLSPNDDIVRFEYLKKTNKERGPALIGLESTDSKNFEILNEKLAKAKIKFEDITDKEIYFDLLI